MNEPLSNSSPADSPPKMPLWVKVFGIILLIVVIIVGIVLLSGGEHGPGRHMPSSDGGSSIAFTSLSENR